jgi:hypothetical protein
VAIFFIRIKRVEMKIACSTLRGLSLLFLVIGMYGMFVTVVPELEFTVMVISSGSLLLAGNLFVASRSLR